MDLNKINNSNQWLIESLGMTNIGNWQWDIKNDIVTWSDELYKIYGINVVASDVTFQEYLERIHPDDRKRVKATIENALKTKLKISFDERIVGADKKIHHLRSWGSVKTDESGKPVKMYIACIDITETKKKELVLAKKEKEFEIILERVSDAFVALDKNWIYTYVNVKAAQIFGRKPETLIGKNIWTEFPEGVGQPFYKAYFKAMETQQYGYLLEYYPPYDLWFENRIYPSHEGLTIYFADVTFRVKAEKALNSYKEELEEKVKARTIELENQNEIIIRQKGEIEDIIKELHHRVKNNMQIISSLLSLQSNMVDDPKVREMFTDCQNRVHSMALIHEKMYQSNSLTRVNAKDYLPELINDIVRSSTLTKNIGLDLKIDDVEIGTKMMVPIGLLVNEIVLNSVKHAFQSSDNGKIICQFSKIENDKFKLILGDNGSGIDKKKFKKGSLGMDIIEAFVNQLDGTFKILNQPGTVYEIEFKLREWLRPII